MAVEQTLHNMCNTYYENTLPKFKRIIKPWETEAWQDKYGKEQNNRIDFL